MLNYSCPIMYSELVIAANPIIYTIALVSLWAYPINVKRVTIKVSLLTMFLVYDDTDHPQVRLIVHVYI